MLKTTKKCLKCGEVKDSSEFHTNNARDDSLNIYCKKCIIAKDHKLRGITNELTAEEESLLLKYYPFAHHRTFILCHKPGGENKDESQPLTLAGIARDNGITFQKAQGIFYKFTRLGLSTLIIKGDEEGKIEILIHYKKDNIRDYLSGE